ncbi:helix-turn-helix domain-containing protein [Nocardiopsis ganjiahuensis]|uniref:helix-turn-helix domain-containing protein n=1 Tax=Nocardiopsis ganjiahuensis TaxID=239984 RepID=UPI00034D765C|nr:helix-turn-helix transcriptional regulator [Nocardiopsis ganjiahuensis]
MFSAELRFRRQQAGMSLEALARKVHYSKSHLSKLENGAKKPSQDLARACDAALAADGQLSRLAAEKGPGNNLRNAPGETPNRADGQAEPPTDDQEVWLMSMTPDGGTGFVGMDRRTALSLGALSVLGAGTSAGPAVGGTAPRARLDTEPALASFRTQLGELRTMGQRMAPTMVFPIAIAQTNALRQLARSAPPAQRGVVLRLAARFAEYTGWMAQESGSEQQALWWTDTAVSLAEAGGSREMGAYALVRRALVTMYAHDSPRTIALAQRAQRNPETSTRVRGLAAKREAQGHALAGDLLSCERALERARALLASDEAAPESGRRHGPEVLGSRHVSDPVGVTRGWCLVDLGRAEEAARVLDQECALIPVDAVRARTRFGVRRAIAHALSGEVDQACVITTELLTGSSEVGSATVRLDLRRLHQTLARYHGHRSVQELSPMLLTALSRA